jgi:hypothetical protein
MLGNHPVKVMYIQQPIPVRKKSYRSPHYFTSRSNQVAPRPVFTCIDEVYAFEHVFQPPLEQPRRISYSSSHKSKDDTLVKTSNWRKWLLIIVIIVIIACIITIIILLAVFLTRQN